jgi:enterochelin esterase family protein
MLMFWTGWMVPAMVAQPIARPAPTPNDTLVSPRLWPDGRVTFQLFAPNATRVTLSGDWIDWSSSEKLAKNDQGVWSVTVGPLEPDVHTYWFTVDSLRIVDPKNAEVKEGIRSLESLFEVPGPEAEFLARRDVPHGTVSQVWYRSKSLGADRRMHVYTPPGYGTSGEALPVLYLLHGGGDTDSGWSTVGRANFILDNLLAESKIEPMIVVMPAGHTTAGFHMGAGPDQDPFSKDLIEDIIPYVEAHYRVAPGSEHRAISGLSMGGVQTLNIGLFNPDKFAYVAPMSTGYFPPALEEMEKTYAAVLDDPKINERIKFFWIAIGDADFAYPNNKNTMALLDRHGIRYTYYETGGGHTWANWRRYLRDLAPLLFR